MVLPVYVINLDRRPDRWQTISENLDRIGVKANRIQAVDANALSNQDEGFGTIDEDIPVLPTHLGDVAVMLSHLRALRRLVTSSADAALVLEDDAEIASSTPSLLESMDWWPPATGIIRLEHHSGKRARLIRRPCASTPDGREVRRLEQGILGAAGYLIKRDAALAALDVCANPDRTFEEILFDSYLSKTARKFGTAQIVPAMVRQTQTSEANPSDLRLWLNATEPDQRRTGNYRLRRKFKHLHHKAKSHLLILAGIVQRVPVAYVDIFDTKQDTR